MISGTFAIPGANGASASSRNAWRGSTKLLAAAGRRAFPQRGDAIKALACEILHTLGIPLSRFSVSKLKREAIGRGFVDSIGETPLWPAAGETRRPAHGRALLCSALDPTGTEAVEELIWELRGAYTILIVTHNMAQARRASEEYVFMLLGKVVEHSPTGEMFVTPQNQETADYIEGRNG